MLWLMLAAQISAAPAADDHLSDVRRLFVADDVPSYLVHSGEVFRTVYTRTTVRDDGAFENCAVEISSGDKKLDLYTCALIAKRARLHPVKWLDGSPVYSVLRFPVSWVVTEGSGPSEDRMNGDNPDLELSVNQLPKGARKTVAILLELRADETGKILSCGELPPGRSYPQRHYPELIPVVCAEATKTLVLRPPLDRSGKPVKSVQTAVVQVRSAS